MNCSMPEPVSSRPDSGAAISDADRTRVWPRSSKNARNDSRMSDPFTPRSLAAGLVQTVLRAQLALAGVGRAAALLEGGAHQLRQVDQPALRFPGDRLRG